MTRLRSVASVALPALAVALVLASLPAGAHRVPANCDSNSLDITPTRDKIVIRNGDTITYTVTLNNLDKPGQIACDVTAATVTFALPAKDGSPTGEVRTLATGQDYPAGTPVTVLGTVSWVVDVNPGVTDAVVEAKVTGALHDAPVDHSLLVERTLGTGVTQPHTTLTVTPNPASGRAPLTVTYTYVETNDSSTDAPISGVTLTDDICSPVTLTGGDVNGNSILDTGETWTFTCTHMFTEPGTYTNHVTATGINVVDGLEHPIERAEVSVTATSPHTTLTVTPEPSSGPAPLTVTYAYVEVNDGTDPISGVTLADDICSPVTLTGGDGNADGVLDPGETWTFTCTHTFTEPGTYTNHVTGTGISIVDQMEHPLERAEATVNVQTQPSPEVSPTVLGELVAPAPSLPVTGADVARIALVALLALAAGALFLLLSARRKRRA